MLQLLRCMQQIEDSSQKPRQAASTACLARQAVEIMTNPP